MKNPDLRESYEEMMEYAYYTARRDEIIIDAWNTGVPAARIAEQMSIGRSTVHRVLKDAGIRIGEAK